MCLALSTTCQNERQSRQARHFAGRALETVEPQSYRLFAGRALETPKSSFVSLRLLWVEPEGRDGKNGRVPKGRASPSGLRIAQQPGPALL